MNGTIGLVVGLMMAVAFLAVLARKVSIAYPILFVIGGLVLGFIPHLPVLHLKPELIFVLFLPPLLYPASVFTPWRDFRANLGPILRLAIGLVLLTTVAVAWFAHHYMGLPWAAGFVLGAIISPPDAVAATAITSTLRVPRRIVTILDGESLVNDATSFTAYRFAVAAVLTGSFSLVHATGRFFIVVIGGVAVGLAVGWVVSMIQKRLDDPPVQTTLSLLTPYVTYLLAEAIETSGVLAVVVAGLYVGWQGPEILNARMRLVAYSFWTMVVFLLNGFIFILIGLQLPDVVHDLEGYTLRQAAGFSVAVLVLLNVVRFLWFFVSSQFARWFDRHRKPRLALPTWRHLVLVSWAGMRGVDSLAAALALPFFIDDKEPFPERDLIVFVTFAIILGTLVLQGLTLPPLIRWLRIDDDRSQEEEERQARLAANEAALARLNEVGHGHHVDVHLVARLKSEYQDRIQQLQEVVNTTGDQKKLSLYSVDYERLSREILLEERKAILHLRNERVINDNVLRRIQRDLDLAEARLESAAE